MKHSLLYFLLFVSVSEYVAADETPPTDPIAADQPRTYERYTITLAEYRLKKQVATDATENEIISFIHDQKIEPVETVRLSTISDTESLVEFGKQVTVTTGKVTNGILTSSQTQQIDIGTLLRIRIVPHELGTLAEISYATSRLEGDGSDYSPPDINKITIDSTQFLEIAKPRLIGATSAGQSSFVLVMVNKLP